MPHHTRAEGVCVPVSCGCGMSDVKGGTGGDFVDAEAGDRLAALAAVESLADLVALTDVDDEHAAYFDAEREWATRGRDERTADYAVSHHGDADAVHPVVGAAHGPGVAYYLRRHRDGERSVEAFTVA